METTARPYAPAIGVDPDFDRFVDERMSEIGDYIQEETSLAAEFLEDGEDLRAWYRDRVAELRADLYVESLPGLDTLEEALEHAQEQISRLSARNRKLVRSRRAPARHVWRLESENGTLKSQMESADAPKLCKACGKLAVEKVCECGAQLR